LRRSAGAGAELLLQTMATLLGRKLKPIKFGEGALRVMRQDNAFYGVQLRRRRSSKGRALGRPFPSFLGVCLHGV
jgi:hypothetical protein